MPQLLQNYFLKEVPQKFEGFLLWDLMARSKTRLYNRGCHTHTLVFAFIYNSTFRKRNLRRGVG